MIHICTTDSLMAGSINITCKCPVCDETTEQQLGYIESRCTNCGQYYSSDDWRGSIVRKRREALRMTRKQFAQLLGVETKTLAKYETTRCPEKTWNDSLKIFTSRNNNYQKP